MKVLVFLAMDDPIAAYEMLATLSLSWERFGSNLARRPAIVWTIGPEFYNSLEALVPASMRRSPVEGDLGAHPLGDRGDLSPAAGTFAQTVSGLTLPLQFTCEPAGKAAQAETHEVVIRLLLPGQYAGRRAGSEPLIELYRDACKTHGRPDLTALVGLTSAIPHDEDAEAGAGIDQLLNPLFVARMRGELGEAPRCVVALSGFEPIFADFFPLSRNEGVAPVKELPWRRHATAFAAARDPEIMRNLIAIALASRPHLLNMQANSAAFATDGAAPLRYVPILPRGFLATFGCVNHDPATGAWRIGHAQIRNEMQFPDVIPYGSCDPLLAAILDEAVTVQYALPAVRTPSRQGRFVAALRGRN